MSTFQTSFSYTDLPLLLQQMAGIQVTSPSAETTYTQSMLREGNQKIKKDNPAFFDKLLDVGAVLALHDTWMPAIQKMIRFILSNRDYVAVPTSQESKPRRSIRSRLAQAAGRACNTLPWSERIFAPKFLTPWRSYGFRNIALLKKVADDRRDWRAFKNF